MTDTLGLRHHFEICLSVNDLRECTRFYKKLGFEIYNGGPDKGWCTVTDGLVYLVLFPGKYIEKEFGIPVLFNYRGGNIEKIIHELKSREITFSKESVLEQGTGNALFTCPNGRVFFFDTSEDEDRIDTPD